MRMAMLKDKIGALLLVLITLCSNTGFACEVTIKFLGGRVFIKPAASDPFSITEGKYQLASGTSILTFLDGQFIGETEEKVDIRMKEETIVSFSSVDEFDVRKGVAGFKNNSGSRQINTPHVTVSLQTGVLVIKSNSVLTRICLIKGNAFLKRGNNELMVLPEGQEIAASLGKISRPYKMSDELRYTWYWVEPEKEPALQN